MKKLEQFVTMRDGQEIFVRIFEPEHTIGHFHILHGMGEHSGRYESFAEMLCDHGFFVSMHDHRGHGHTAKGDYGYFADELGFHKVVTDVLEVLKYVRMRVDVPLTLFGHSMGSFIARRFIQLYSNQVDRCILCGTGTTTALHIAGNKLALALVKTQGPRMESKLMNDLSFGSFNKAFKLPKTAFDWLCSDEKEVQKYIDDPMCGFIATNQFFADLTEGLLLINRKEEISRMRTDLPILFISGSEDPVGNAGQGVFKVASKMTEVGMENVGVYLFEGMRHEILNEKNKQHVYDVIIRWLKHDKQKI
ncbi:alpha/beta hydrolase [Solibacillus sp. CAU 1738]|uniref:alpha/beta hydrolase n=1 Tax=Solibacillus sp. CAU 1738 TaxID=3140363 RepID=UPI0032612D29